MHRSRWGTRATGSAMLLASLAATTLAGADAAPIPGPGQYGVVGINAGVSGHQVKSNGFVFGAEASFPYLFESVSWVGLYGDVLRDFGDSSTRFSVGPEVGWGPFGIDGGLLVRTMESATRMGWQMRGLLTLGVIALYAGYGNVPNDPEDRGITQFGMLLKVPFPIWDGRGSDYRRYRGRPPPERPAETEPTPSPPASVVAPASSPPGSPPAPAGPWAEPPP